MGLVDVLKNLFRIKKEVRVPLDPESVKQNTLIKALSYENAELKGDNAKKDKFIAEFREREKDKEEEENVKVILDEEKKELMLKSQGKVFSLKYFFARYFRDKKFRDRLAYYSFDRSNIIAPFGDLAFSDDGDFVILDNKGNMILRMASLKDIFQSVGGLGYDIGSGKIPINLDSDGGYIENIMTYEAPELIATGNKLKFAKARKRPVYEIIQGLNNQIGELQQDLAESEMHNTQLQNKVDSLEANLKVNEDMSETSRAELTENEERLVGIDRVFRRTQRDQLRLLNITTIQEDSLNKVESEIIKMREEAERQGVKLSDEKAIETIMRIRSTLANELPDFEVQQVIPTQNPAQNQQNTGYPPKN